MCHHRLASQPCPQALKAGLPPTFITMRSARSVKYGPEVDAALTICWTVRGTPAGKRLAPMLTELVAVLRQFRELVIGDQTEALPCRCRRPTGLGRIRAVRLSTNGIRKTASRKHDQSRSGALGEILGDTTVAAAMLDRLLHRMVVLNLDGKSIRHRDHDAAAITLRRTTTGPTTTLTAAHR